jgi:DNA-binding transcriptional MocR family regulator
MTACHDSRKAAVDSLYAKLADELTVSCAQGVLRSGDKLPSIREASQSRGLSVTTVKRAYQLLESRGMVEARPKSGYFVKARAAARLSLHPPEVATTSAQDPDVGRLVLDTLRAISIANALPLASPYPDPALLPWQRVRRHVTDVARKYPEWSATDDLPPGDPELIRQIAFQHLRAGLDVEPSQIVITGGATEAINLCLQAVAEPGDTIAVESPLFYLMRQAIDRMRMRAVEVPTDASTGIDLAALDDLATRQRIDACLTMPNFQNPMGFSMTDEAKQAFVQLAVRHDIPLIENGVYNQLHFDAKPPTTLKSFDRTGIVLHCNSFSKSLTSATRVGWAIPGRYRERVENLKVLSSLGTSAITQMAIARYLARDNWEHHLRGMRQQLAQRMAIMRASVTRFLPPGTRVSDPQGGFLLWVELPAKVDSLALYKAALESGITIAPGRFFSSNRNRNCIRLNCSYPWTNRIESGIRQLGRIAARLESHAG